ncbi:terminase [Salmonella enterica]|nr:terminase [Salmonella enterica]
MAKTDWKKLEQKFQRAHDRTGIKLRDWCQQNNISYNTARTQIKLHKSDQKSDHKNDHESDQKNDHNSESFSEKKTSRHEACDEDDGAENSEENCAENETDFAKTKRIRGSRFVAPTNAFQPRNTVAVKHRGYAKHLEKDYLFDDAAEMALVDELVFTRARALSVTATLKRMFTELEKTEDILARTALYGKMMQAETALDRNIARIESIERTLGTLDIIAVTPARIVADTEYRVAAREKVKAETQRLTAENQGVTTPLTEAIDELQSLNKGGKL